MATFTETLQFSFSSFLLQASSQGDFLPSGFFTSGSNRYTIAIRGAHTSRAYPQYQFLFSTGLTLRDVDDFSVTLRWGTTNELVLDFSDYADRTDPYDFRPSDAATRNQLNNLYRWIRAGGRNVNVTLENNPRITNLGISGETSAGTAAAGILESSRAFSWEWDIVTAQASAARWADIGIIADTDDIAIPMDLLREAGTASFNRIRSRGNQLRITLVGDDPRLSVSFENQGTIWLQNASTGEILATIKNIGSFWNDANKQYRINSNTPFIFSSRDALRTAIRAMGVGETVRIVLAKPPAGLEVYAASDRGTAGIGLSTPRLEISPQSEPGTGLVNVEKIPDLRIRARSTLATASGNVTQPTNLGITAKSLAGTAGANLASQAAKILARSGAGTASVSARKPTKLLAGAKSGTGAARVKTSAPELRILAQSLAGAGAVTVEDNKGIRISRRARRGTASANLRAPDIKVLAETGQGTASTNLPPPKLKIGVQNAGGTINVGVEKQTKIFSSAQSGTGTARLNLEAPTLSLSAQTRQGTGAAFVKQPGLTILSRSLAGTGRTNLSGPEIKVLARSSPGAARVGLAGADFKILARSLDGTGQARLQAPGLRISRRSRRGTGNAGLFSPSTLKILAKSVLGEAQVKTSAPPLRAFAESGLGTGGMNLMIPDRPRDFVREAFVEGQPIAGSYMVAPSGGKYSTDAEGGNFSVSAIK